MPVSVHSWLPGTAWVYVLAGVVVALLLGVGDAACDDGPGAAAGWVLAGDGDEDAATAIVIPEPVRCRCWCAVGRCASRAFR